MSPLLQTAAGLALAGVAAALFGLSPVAAVAASALGVVVAVFGGLTYNVPGTRALVILALLAHAAIVRGYTDSSLVAGAVLLPAFAVPPQPIAVRRLGYRAAWLIPLCLIAGIGLVLLDWPPRLQWWAAAPVLGLGAWISRGAIDVNRRLMRQARPRWSLEVGDEVPDFELPARGGGRFRLSEQRGHFVFLHFMRSDWCPLCQVMLRVLRNAAPKLEGRNVRVVVVSPSEGPEAEGLARDMGLDYVIAIDPSHETAKRFGAFDPDSYGGRGSPLPVGFLIGPERRLRHASDPENVNSFLDPDEVLAIVDPPQPRLAT